MTENNHLLFRVRQILSTNLCDCTTTIDPENHNSCLDKIRAFFVPSLEPRLHSLLEQFLYGTDSRWKEQYLHFKKFVKAIGRTRRIFPNETAECDIGAISWEVVKHVVKNDLVRPFLNSIILRHRLDKICRELNAIGIDIARGLNVWGFVNDENNQMDRNWFTCPDIGAGSSTNSTILVDAKEPIGCVESSAENNDDRRETIERPTSSEHRASIQFDDSRQNSNHFATESHSDDVDKVQVSRKTSCDTASNKVQRHKPGLKLVMRKLHMEDCSCSTLSRPVISRLRLPCKPSDLIGRIFEADPSLSESCLIVIKRKFQADVRNLCSCLNDVLEKLSVEFTNTSSRLYCDIRPGYISFKLKIDKVADKCPFVARVPICQNVRKHTMCLQNFVVSCDCDPNPSESKANETRCSERCKNDDNNFCNTLVSIGEKSEVSNDTCCSGQAFVKSHVAVNTSQCKTENISEKVTVSVIIQNNDSECAQDITVSCCNELGENIIEKEESPDDSSNSIALLTNESTLCEDLTERNNVSANEEFNNSPQIRDDDDKRDRMIRSPDQELHRRNEDFAVAAAATSSIVSFVQHSENDKQLVELNCNCFSDNYSKAIDEQQSDPQDVESTNVEIGCDSDLSCPANDIVNITLADNIFDDVFNRKPRDDNATNAGNSEMTTKLFNNNLLANSSIRTSRLKVSSKGITVDVSCPQSVVCLASNDRNNISTVVKTCDRCNKKIDPAVCYCTAEDILSNVTKKENQTVCDNIGFNVSDRPGDFMQSRKRFPTLKERLGYYSNASLSDGLSTEEFYEESNSTYMASRRFSYSTAGEFAPSRKRDKSQNAYRLQKPSRFRQRGRSSSDIFYVNSSFAATKHRRASCRCQNDNYAGDTRPQVIFVLTKFRNSVDRSLGKIKRLIHTKLDRVFSNRSKTTNMWKTLWKNEESSDYIRKSRGKCRRQNYSVTSCSLSTSDYCKQGCVFSSESSDVTLSIIRNRSGERCEKGKFCGFAGEGEALRSVRSIEALWSRDLLTSTLKTVEEQESSELLAGTVVRSACCTFRTYRRQREDKVSYKPLSTGSIPPGRSIFPGNHRKRVSTPNRCL